MDVKERSEKLRQMVIQQSSSAEAASELLACIDAWEREPQMLERLRQLEEENAKLIEQMKKLRAVNARDYMSSRLREALRE